MAELRETYATQFEQIEARRRRKVAETRDYEAALARQYFDEEAMCGSRRRGEMTLCSGRRCAETKGAKGRACERI
jgi:hypothetical protein